MRYADFKAWRGSVGEERGGWCRGPSSIKVKRSVYRCAVEGTDSW